MPSRNPKTDDRDFDTSKPWIVIPYFVGDEGRPGQRPLNNISPPVVTWICPSIKVQGVNYTTVPGSYLPDEPLAITVDVDNRGVPTTLVTVDVYWADPSTGFTKKNWILSSSFPVAGRSVSGPTKSPKMIWTPDRSKIPPHFCLLVHATSSSLREHDPGPDTPDVNERHWAQYNLQSTALSASNKLTSVFWATNPEIESAAFTVMVRPVAEEGLKMIARMVNAEPVGIKNKQLALYRTTEDSSVQKSREASLVLELEPGERQPLVVSANSLELALHQFTAFEVVQTRLGIERDDGAITGSLGVVVFAAGDQYSCQEFYR